MDENILSENDLPLKEEPALPPEGRTEDSDDFAAGFPDAEGGVTEDIPGDMPPDGESPAAPASAAPARSFEAEIDELVKAKPHIFQSPLPEEVVKDCVMNGKPLVQAYLDFEERSRADADRRQQTAYDAVRAENEALRRSAQAAAKENRALRQNAEAAERAPVKGVSGGGATDTRPGDDPFLRGFDSDGW